VSRHIFKKIHTLSERRLGSIPNYLDKRGRNSFKLNVKKLMGDDFQLK
jgi:hypothetical protein